MNKFKKFFTEAVKKANEEHTLLKSLSTDPVKLTTFLQVTTLPSTFVKTFVYDYAEEIDKFVNTYAEEHRLEIKSISIYFLDSSNVFSATVLFERGCP